jgi:lysyl-tRNA synthetase class 2
VTDEQSDLLAERRVKLERLREAGIEPYPHAFPDRTEIAAVREAYPDLDPGEETGDRYRVAGRLTAKRGHGKASFLDVRDGTGQIQIQARVDELGDDAYEGLISLDVGDIIGIEGTVFASKRGELTLRAEAWELLSKSLRPPPEKFHGLEDVETRYRRRELDLMANEESRELFRKRNQTISAVRRWLDSRGFVEVETPVLQPRYGGAFAHPFVTHSNELDVDLYLRIATELYLKRLIVGGLERVYEIGKDFRNESVSYKHQPEFTMLEWYEAYADFHDTMNRIETMLELVAIEALGTTVVQFRGHEVDLKRPWRRVAFVEALEAHELWTRDESELRAWLTERGVDTDADKDWPQLVDHAFGHFVEPSLLEPTIVYGHPVQLSPFARVTDDDETVTERFEYFAAGMELGNAYTEINDAAEQQLRFDEQSAHVEGVRGDPDYVEALSYGMPPTGGLGLGIDRLVMLLSGRETIRDVILFPALRAQ